MPVKQNKRKAKSIIGEPAEKEPAIIKEVKFVPVVEVVEETKEMEPVKIKKDRPKTMCTCGIEIANSGMKRHLEGKKHKEAME
uniref:Uncharacterized protein n=1 Tax=viral metagenome TaxID=1070528 RepID=A0A6C0JZ50_9ZZZZ